MSWWIGRDWDKESMSMIVRSLEFFNLDYLMRCPNVCDPTFAADWPRKDRAVFSGWLAGEVLPRKECGKYIRKYNWNPALSYTAHQGVLWQLLRPKNLLQVRPQRLSKAKTLPGHEVFKDIQPVHSRLSRVARARQLARIEMRCRSGGAQ